MRAIRRLTVRPVLPAALAPLGELAANLRWSWDAPTAALFTAVDPQAWTACGGDPVRLLGAVSAQRWAALAADAGFVERVRGVHADLRTYLDGDRWYQALGPAAPRAIGYFSPEYGVAAVLPQYSGGLGILAGDHLKAASDLGLPMVAVGLLYRHGYFRQSLSREGWQQEIYPVLDPEALPLVLLREADGAPARVHVGLPGGRRLAAAVWVARVGRVPLLLLDSDVQENGPAERDVTDRLYGGGTEHRLEQEMLLGIGGVRALRAWSRLTGAPEPEVFHTNEGHAGFLGVERIRELVEDRGLSVDAAVEAARAGTVFTTHTPVPAGIDRFPRELVRQHFGGDNGSPGVPVESVLALGAETFAGGDPGVFNMAVMGLRLSQRANGVSLLHGAVSRGMFRGLWPDFDEAEVPITSVTNGVHAPTWTAPEIAGLPPNAGDDALWQTRRLLRERLVHDVRRRVRDSHRQRGASEAELGWVDGVLDPDVATIGFARRVPSYKRLTLMLRDRDRLRAMLLDTERPLQIVVAGKAHPADDGGKALIQEMVRFADDPAVRHRIVVLPDYDMAMARTLYPGCDVWLNNPLRPYEACGTSGMKSALNGGLNLSIRDGWWDEEYDAGYGWAIPSAEGVLDHHHRDGLEAAALYDLLEQVVVPRFYDADAAGLPRRWLEMVQHTLTSLAPRLAATRMVGDYVERLYIPAAGAARRMREDHAAHDLARWKRRVRREWHGVRVDHVEGEVADSAVAAIGSRLALAVYVSLGALTPDDVEVQLLHGRVGDSDVLAEPVVQPLEVAESYEAGRHRYEGELALSRAGALGYTVRVVPRHEGLAGPAEMGLAAVPPEPVGLTEGDLR